MTSHKRRVFSDVGVAERFFYSFCSVLVIIYYVSGVFRPVFMILFIFNIELVLFTDLSPICYLRRNNIEPVGLSGHTHTHARARARTCVRASAQISLSPAGRISYLCRNNTHHPPPNTLECPPRRRRLKMDTDGL